MKAEETVMWAKNPQILSNIAEQQNKLLLAQAEISFKAGYFEGRGLGIRDGIREVVEWTEDNVIGFAMTSERVNIWQAKLKEWGVK